MRRKTDGRRRTEDEGRKPEDGRRKSDGGRKTEDGIREQSRPSSVVGLPSFFDQVYAVVRLIPKGKVATYGQVAALLEHPRAARTVGWALNGLLAPLAARVPWHRVINAEGRISNALNFEEQLRRLKKEGIKFDKTGRCDLRKYLWEPPGNFRF